MTGLDDATLAEIRARAEAAADRPWYDDRSIEWLTAALDPEDWQSETIEADARHIARLDPTTAIALVDEIEAQSAIAACHLGTVRNLMGVTAQIDQHMNGLRLWRTPVAELVEQVAALVAERDAAVKRVEVAEAAVERVRALADEWTLAAGDASMSGTMRIAGATRHLRAALDGEDPS